MIVEPDGLLDGDESRGAIDKALVQQVLYLEDAIDALSQGVVVTVADLAHT